MTDFKGIGLFYVFHQILGVLVCQSQHLIDERCNLARITADGIGQTAAFLRFKLGIILSKHLGKSVDNIQWCAYLMTHTADKLRFHLVGSCHLLISRFQFLILPQQDILIAALTVDGERKPTDQHQCHHHGYHQHDIHHTCRFLLLVQQRHLLILILNILGYHHTRDRIAHVHQFALGHERQICIT